MISVSSIIDFLKINKYDFIEEIADYSRTINGFSSISNYKEGTMTWIKNNNNEYLCENLNSCPLLVIQRDVELPSKDIIPNIIRSNESRRLFFDIIDYLLEPINPDSKIGVNTVIGKDVVIERNVTIGNNCSIEGDISISEGCIIGDNVVIKNKCRIGKNSEIQPGCVIGIDGFGYSEDTNRCKKMIRHHGGVTIGENVFIGAHTNIARGTIDNTIIEDGVVIAPSTHIGHNNHIGKNSVIICSQLYGSVKTGENVYITASTIRNQTIVEKNSMVGMGSVVTKNIGENQVVVGMPSKKIRDRY